MASAARGKPKQRMEEPQAQGSVSGFPEAFLEGGASLLVAVREQGILESKDDGRTWQVYYKDPV